MFELDFLEHKGTSKQSLFKEDRELIQIAERGIQHCEDYELPLPLKNETIELPNNKTAALRRLSQLKGRFMGRNGQQYYEHFVEFMKKLIESGYAESVPGIPEAEHTSMIRVERSRTFGTFHIMEFIIPRSPIRFAWFSIVLLSTKMSR